MARVQLVLPDEDRDRFAHAARREGMSLSEWLRLAAKERMQRCTDLRRFHKADELTDFFRKCEADTDGEAEPDWEVHLNRMNKSRSGGSTET